MRKINNLPSISKQEDLDLAINKILERYLYKQRGAMSRKVGRNDSCPCGSGEKYKKCCMNKDLGIGTKAKILQLKISLNDIKPEIWRRFLVKDNITFEDLHNIIQIVMGWENYHLYEFKVGDINVVADANDFYVDAMWKIFMKEPKKTVPATKTMLGDFLKRSKQKFYYLYDFGDCWEHSIVVEKILEEEDKICPICVDGENACPPEDCGGVWGYLELLEIKENKNHPDYWERIVEWLGEDFDPDYFDINEVNKRLKRLRKLGL